MPFPTPNPQPPAWEWRGRGVEPARGEAEQRAWEALFQKLRPVIRDADGEDVLQDVVVAMLEQRMDPADPGILGLARFMVRCKSIDRYRRKRREVGLERPESVVSGDDGAAEAVDVAVRIGPEACAALGSKAVLLLQELVAGARSNSSLAARLDVDERSIGRRRARIRMVLSRFARKWDSNVLP